MEKPAQELKAYQVWFTNGGTMIVNAVDEEEARLLAISLRKYPVPIERVECLS